MHPNAITKARGRLAIAAQEASHLKNCPTYDEFLQHWYSFLVATKNISTLLEQGAKTDSGSKQWYEAKRRERKADELLHYLYEARNSEEHGMEPVSKIVPKARHAGVSAPNASTIMSDRFGNTFENVGMAWHIEGDQSFDPGLRALDGKPVLTKFTPEGAKLLPVTDRNGKVVPPPTMHRGRPLRDQSPEAIAQLAVAYLEGLVNEAAGLRTSS